MSGVDGRYINIFIFIFICPDRVCCPFSSVDHINCQWMQQLILKWKTRLTFANQPVTGKVWGTNEMDVTLWKIGITYLIKDWKTKSRKVIEFIGSIYFPSLCVHCTLWMTTFELDSLSIESVFESLSNICLVPLSLILLPFRSVLDSNPSTDNMLHEPTNCFVHRWKNSNKKII